MIGKHTYRAGRAGLLAAAGLAAAAAAATAAFVLWRAWPQGAPVQENLSRLADESTPVVLDKEAESRVQTFCSDCHALPRPESFPRYAWYEKVRKGYHYFSRSGRDDLDPPPIWQTVAYFRSRAPEELEFPSPPEAQTELSTKFNIVKLGWRQEPVFQASSHLHWLRLAPDEKPVLLTCDMRSGTVATVDVHNPSEPERVLARLENPCRVEPCDLDGDGATDLVVSDLGSFFPDDHDRGRVVWLRRRGKEAGYEQIVALGGLGRVADARPADVDGDGDLDLIVAEFGMYRTGKVALARNVAAPGERPRFELEEISRSPGPIHVPVCDLDHDGSPDFVALVSQEDEHIEAYLNRDDGHFNRQVLWAAPDLTFGSSGIEMVDLDQDGDLDVLYTNGDAFDNGFVTPSHGVQWLENQGDVQFAYHRLTDMTGAYRALAGDVDLDGDLDIIVTAWLPPEFQPPSARKRPPVSILCLEQTGPGVFVRHTLETGVPYYPTLEMADFDDDGDLDFAVGVNICAPRVKNYHLVPYWLAIWWNQKIPNAK